MPRIQSEIYEEYVKLAKELGLDKQAAEEKTEEHTEYKNEEFARAGSDSISDIELMYGVKPDSAIKYDDNIMEAAHRNSVIIAPSYDKLNGLVENNIERNNIMCNIALKPNDGQSTNKKYAHQELMMELIRLANEMDARNQDELRKLADSCLIELSARQRQSLTRSAVAPAVILAVAAGLALFVGGTWLASHMSDPDTGLSANCTRALEKLNDLSTTSWYESEIDETVKEEVNKLIAHIQQIKEEATKLDQINDMVYKPRTLSETEELNKLKASMEDHGSEMHKTIEEFANMVKETKPLLDQAIANFKSDYYQHQHSKKETWLSELTGRLGDALHGRWGLIANDYISAANALKPLEKSMEEAVQRLTEMPNIVAKKEEEIKSGAAQASTGLSEPSGESSKKPEEGHFREMVKNLFGKEPSQEEKSFFSKIFQ